MEDDTILAIVEKHVRDLNATLRGVADAGLDADVFVTTTDRMASDWW